MHLTSLSYKIDTQNANISGGLPILRIYIFSHKMQLYRVKEDYNNLSDMFILFKM